MKVTPVIVLFSAFSALLAPQEPSIPEATAALYGHVTNAQTHEPIRRAFVKIYTSKQEWDELSDSEGVFKFPPLKRAEYNLAVHRDGFTERYYKIELSDFDNPKELPLELFPQGVITGKVVDGFGLPLRDAEITALPTQKSAQRNAISARTNDLGEYRVAGLDPAVYQIRATYREGREHEFDSTPITRASAFYGGVTKPAELPVKSGSTISGIDFILNPVRPVAVRGTLHTETGQPAGRITLWIEGPAPGREGSHDAQAEDGKFEITEISPGSYRISADTYDDDPTPMFGAISIEVGGEDLSGVDLVLRPAPKIEGQIQVRGGDISSLAETNIMFSPADGTIAIKSAKPDASGAFQVGLHPAEYAITIFPLPHDLAIEKITLDETPVLNRRFKVDSAAKPKSLVIVFAPKNQP